MTPLYPTVEKRINDGVNDLIRKQITPWSFMTAGPPFRIMRFDGSEIRYQGIEFEGSPRHVFWSGYIEPFLEHLCKIEVDEAISLAQEKDVDGEAVLSEVEELLVVGVKKIYSEMADVDQRLRGKGVPRSVERPSIDAKVSAMTQFICDHVSVEKEMLKTDAGLNSWYRRHPFWIWVIGLLVVIAGIVLQLW